MTEGAQQGGSAQRTRAARPANPGLARRGFTLLEVLLVIALIAVTSSLFLVSFEAIGRTSPLEEFEGTFWRAMAQAREQALVTRRTVELRWDEEGAAFAISGSGGTARVPVPASARDEKSPCAAAFSEEVAANDFILVRGELVTRRTAPAVRVFPDGSCQAFTVELKLGAAVRRVTIDPWTGAEMLPAGAAGKEASS